MIQPFFKFKLRITNSGYHGQISQMEADNSPRVGKMARKCIQNNYEVQSSKKDGEWN